MSPLEAASAPGHGVSVGYRRYALGLFAWSSMTVMTGMARGFTTLVLARIGVGIGEAAGSPPSHSFISDIFPPERRATALSIYALGIPIGAALGNLFRGWIGEFFGRRTAFFVVGAPGILLVLLVRLTLREPERGLSEGIEVEEKTESVWNVIRFMLKLPSFRHMSLAAAILLFIVNIIGLGLGPLFVGFLSDTLEPSLGVEAIRYALLVVVVVGSSWAVLHYFLAARTLRADLKAKDEPIAA